MALLDSLLQFITHGVIAGLPPLVFMIIPFVVGLVIGFLLKKILKIAIVAAVIIFILTYFGFFNLSFNSLKSLVTQYGPVVVQYAVIIMGIIPLSLGLIIGVILGFIFG
jgi:uncharacterized membrane protein (Fun14 family)